VRAVVEGAFAHFDVVTNERMQVQEALLAKAREDMAALESRIKALEAKLKDLESGG
jgi:BMFP domain-containing protein YqiC